MSHRIHPRVPALLIAACAALLAFAATASAETWVGESSSSFGGEGGGRPEGDLTHGAVSYDTNGSVSFALTTAAPPQAIVEEEQNKTALSALLIKVEGLCEPLSVLGAGLDEVAFPAVGFSTTYFQSSAEGKVILSAEKSESVPATKAISGSTTTLSLSSTLIANQSFNCAFVLLGGEAGGSIMAFPIKPQPVQPPPPPPPPGQGSPAKLVITKPKPAELKVGKWKSVKVKVKNTGDTTLTQGSLRVKGAKGVNLKPETQKLPALAPGDSFALSIRVQLSKPKKKTTLSLTASGAGAITGTSSLVVKLKS